MRAPPFIRLLTLLALLTPTWACAQSPRQQGKALRAKWAKQLDKRLAGRVVLEVDVGGRRVGSVVLRTDLLERNGKPIYRIHDRLTLSLPGLGALSMWVRADLRPDLSALEVSMGTEEPRGRGTVSTERVQLKLEKGQWVRYVSRGVDANRPTFKVLEDVPKDVLVLTPPLGVGERLSRLAPAELGQRISLPGLYLETGDTTPCKHSVEDRLVLKLAKGRAAQGIRMVRRVGPAHLEVVRRLAPASPPLRFQLGKLGRLPRLQFRDATLRAARPDPASPTGVVRGLLAAIGRSDAEAIRAALDLDALYSAAGGKPHQPKLRAAFERVLLARLSDVDWLSTRGLDLSAQAAAPRDLRLSRENKRVRVSVGAAKSKRAAFTLAQRAGRWRVVSLPRAAARK